MQAVTELLPRSTPNVRRAAARFLAAQAHARTAATIRAMHDNDAVPEPAELPVMPMVRLLTEDAVAVRRHPETGAVEVLMRAGGGEFDTLPIADAVELGVVQILDQALDLFD